MQNRNPSSTLAMLFILSLCLSIYYVIPVKGSQVSKQIPCSGKIKTEAIPPVTEWGTQVWYHPDPDFQMSRVKDMGAKWIRLAYDPIPNAGWPDYEEYEDRVVAAARNNGIEPLIIVNYPNEADITPVDYGLEVERLVRKWGLSAVELGNEPGVFGTWTSPQAYVDRIREGYLGAKRANPNCTVIAPFGMMSEPIECDGGDSVGLLTLADLKPHGFFDYIDALAIHPYTMESDPDTWTGHGFTKYNELVGLTEIIQYLKDWLAANGYANFPLWVTECGFGTNGVYQDTFPEWLVRQAQIHQEQGIVVSLQYCFWLTEGETHYVMTLVNNDAALSYKPMGQAYKEFIAAQ